MWVKVKRFISHWPGTWFSGLLESGFLEEGTTVTPVTSSFLVL